MSGEESPVEIVKQIQKKVLEARKFIGRKAGWLFVAPDDSALLDCVADALQSREDADYEVFDDIGAVLISDPWLDKLDATADFEACLRSRCVHFRKFRVVEW